jgi:hypothetical protein
MRNRGSCRRADKAWNTVTATEQHKSAAEHERVERIRMALRQLAQVGKEV